MSDRAATEETEDASEEAAPAYEPPTLEVIGTIEELTLFPQHDIEPQTIV